MLLLTRQAGIRKKGQPINKELDIQVRTKVGVMIGAGAAKTGWFRIRAGGTIGRYEEEEEEEE